MLCRRNRWLSGPARDGDPRQSLRFKHSDAATNQRHQIAVIDGKRRRGDRATFDLVEASRQASGQNAAGAHVSRVLRGVSKLRPGLRPDWAAFCRELATVALHPIARVGHLWAASAASPVSPRSLGDSWNGVERVLKNTSHRAVTDDARTPSPADGQAPGSCFFGLDIEWGGIPHRAPHAAV